MTTRADQGGLRAASVLDALIRFICPNCSGTGEYQAATSQNGTIRCPACGHRPELAEHVRRSPVRARRGLRSAHSNPASSI